MENTLEFEKRETITIDINNVAEGLADSIVEVLNGYEGLSYDDIAYVDLGKIKLAVAKLWLEENSEKRLTK